MSLRKLPPFYPATFLRLKLVNKWHVCCTSWEKKGRPDKQVPGWVLDLALLTNYVECPCTSNNLPGHLFMSCHRYYFGYYHILLENITPILL